MKLPVQETLNIGTSEYPFVIKYESDEACSRIQVFLKETKYRLDKVNYNIPKVFNDYEVRPENSITSDNGRVYDYIREHELIVESKGGFVYSVTSLR